MIYRKKLITIIVLFLALGRLSATPSYEETEESAYESELAIPPIANFEEQEDTKVFSIAAQASSNDFVYGTTTQTLYYKDISNTQESTEENTGASLDYLGPTIIVEKNDKVAIRVENRLGEETTLHQHGLHIPADADGNVFQSIVSGDIWTSSYTVTQGAGTFWYHPHPNKATGTQVSQGLAGLLIIRDGSSEALGLPHSYGVDDIPLVIQDKDFYEDKIIYEAEGHHTTYFGNIGSTLISNGKVSPYFRSQRALLRLRLLNASTFAEQTFRFSNGQSFYLIANDASLLDKAYEMSSISLGPSERREILVDISALSPEEEIKLISNVHGIYEAVALTIIADVFEEAQTKIPEQLNASLENVKLITEIEKTQREIILGGYIEEENQILLSINGEFFDINKVNMRIPLGSVEEWTVTVPENSEVPHSLHPHFGSFQILSINGEEPTPDQRGLKDTVFLYPGESARIIMRFNDYTGKYLFHCHQLEHEDAGMMGVFEVFQKDIDSSSVISLKH